MSPPGTDEAQEASLAESLGPGSPVYERATERLEELYSLCRTMRPVAVAFQEWARWLDKAEPGGEATARRFFDHTYFSLACRSIAAHVLAALPPKPRPADLLEVVNGDHFIREGISNFLGEDFFTWPFLHLSLGGQTPKADDPALSVLREMFGVLSGLNLTHPTPRLLRPLFRAFAGAEGNQGRTPDVLDCGDGTLLAEAVAQEADRLVTEGEDPMDVVASVPFGFMGMTVDPVGMTAARTNYLLALAGLLRGPHPPALIPVYLADAGTPPSACPGPGGEPVYTIHDAQGIVLPHQVVSDPLYLDWLLDRLGNYLRGAALRARAQSEEEAVQEVLNAYYNYLVSPKPRTPIPEPLTADSAGIMVEAARHLVLEYVRGSGFVPVFLARNAPAPIFVNSQPTPGGGLN